ncbi:MAG: MspA family porin [Gordonia sp. (in: high G+C Gram-positive bacteria)]|uniref:MspA family porin n=1 Tax=Gordonia sp. (in: high G+C Gram-positive bacteria) TaxID=84139 RepID=UPI0039E5C317
MNSQLKSVTVVAAAIAAATAGVVAAPQADAGRIIHLPGQVKNATLHDGTKVTIRRTNERAILNGSMGATGAHRNAAVSGKYEVTANKKWKRVEIRPGYIVGCQVKLVGGGGTHGFNGSNNTSQAGGSLTLGPGQAATYYLTEVERLDDWGEEKHTPKVVYDDVTRGRYSYTNSQLSLNGCAGYAQARSLLEVFIETDYVGQSLTMYGKPFSMG